MRLIAAALLCLAAVSGAPAFAQREASAETEDSYVLAMLPRLAALDLNSRDAVAGVSGAERLDAYGTQRFYISQWRSSERRRFPFYLIYSTHGPVSSQTAGIEVRVNESGITLDQVRGLYPAMTVLAAPFVADPVKSSLYELPGTGNRVQLVFNARGRLTHIFVKARDAVRLPNLFTMMEPVQVDSLTTQWPIPMGRPDPNGRSGKPCTISPADTATLVKLFGRQMETPRQIISVTGTIGFVFRMRNGGEIFVMVPIAPVLRSEPRMAVLPGGLYVELNAADAKTIDIIAGNCP